MKILLVNRSYYPHIGGIENSLFYLSREFKNMGYDVSILTEEIKSNYHPREEYANIIKYPKTCCNKLFLPILPYVNMIQLKKWIHSNKDILKADLVVCRDPMIGVAYNAVFPKTDIVYIPAVVIKFYNNGIRKFNSIRKCVIELLRYSQLKIEAKQQAKILKIAKKNIVFSDNVKKQIQKANLCDINKVEVCFPGVADKFMSEQKNTSHFPAPEFVFVGRLVDEKNLRMLIDAFSMLDCHKKKLTLVGDGDQRIQLENYVSQLGLNNSILFVGSTENPEKYYSIASFFVIPSKYESFGQVISEAMTCGLPVIGFPTIKGKTLTAVEELVQDGVTGFICDDFSANSLCDSLKKAVNLSFDQEKYYSMRQNCIEFSNNNFIWKNLIKSCL